VAKVAVCKRIIKLGEVPVREDWGILDG